MTGMWWGKVLQRGDDGLWLDGVLELKPLILSIVRTIMK